MNPIARLLSSPEGEAAVRLLVPVAEGLADYIAGRREDPPELVDVPATLKSELAYERARFRANYGDSGG